MVLWELEADFRVTVLKQTWCKRRPLMAKLIHSITSMVLVGLTLVIFSTVTKAEDTIIAPEEGYVGPRLCGTHTAEESYRCFTLRTSSGNPIKFRTVVNHYAKKAGYTPEEFIAVNGWEDYLDWDIDQTRSYLYLVKPDRQYTVSGDWVSRYKSREG